jgi:succinyl-CoA synthetase alpha subunit
LEEAARLGTKSATIYTAGFGEGDDAKGKERAQAMKELCERTGMVICGPNCMGSYSVNEGLWTFPTATPLLKRGPVGLIFQSGGSLGNWIKGATERGIGFSYAVSSGNEVSLDLVDYLDFLVDDPDTRVITLMIEGIRRPEEFMAVSERALHWGKPILVVKLGRSEMGKRQAISHTGSLAGADEVFDAVCRRLGLIRCPTLEDMTETTLAFMPGRFPKGSRAAIVVNSGGMKGLICDHCDELKTNLADLGQKTKEAVRPLIPAELAVENPLECGVAGFGDEAGFINIVKLHAEDPAWICSRFMASCRAVSNGARRCSRALWKPLKNPCWHSLDPPIVARMKAGHFRKKPACRSCRRSSRLCERWQDSAYTGCVENSACRNSPQRQAARLIWTVKISIACSNGTGLRCPGRRWLERRQTRRRKRRRSVFPWRSN